MAAFAQPVPQPLEQTASGQAYQASLRLSGIDADVAYFDPTAPPPEFETSETPGELENPNLDLYDNQNLMMAVAIALLIGVGVLAVRHGSGARFSLRHGPANPGREGGGAAQGPARNAEQSADLSAIMNNPDRKTALIELAQLLIGRALSANGLLLQRSWTARDALARLPESQPALGELRDLVLTGERVHFRDQPVSDPEFREFAARASSLMAMLSP